MKKGCYDSDGIDDDYGAAADDGTFKFGFCGWKCHAAMILGL